MPKTRLAVLFVSLLPSLGVAAQDEQPDPLPSLDDLLGVEDEDSSGDAVEQELESELESVDQIGDAFAEAVELMSDSAARLASEGDTGVVTQRIQEDILKKLEQLIEDAQQGSGSPSSSSGAQQQQDNQSQPNQGQQQQEQQEGDQQGEGEPGDASDGPTGQAAQPGESTLNRAAWGALPERLRDALLQGSAESYSSLYRSLTESYYRRLAEETSE